MFEVSRPALRKSEYEVLQSRGENPWKTYLLVPLCHQVFHGVLFLEDLQESDDLVVGPIGVSISLVVNAVSSLAVAHRRKKHGIVFEKAHSQHLTIVQNENFNIMSSPKMNFLKQERFNSGNAECCFQLVLLFSAF